MEKNSVAGLLTSVDELFMTDGEREENQLPRIREIPLSEIDDFPDHPFKVKQDGRYEIVSGHRRRKACELAGLDAVKAEVKELSRDEAIILMVESNLQRTVILPSEKAFSYKMRLEAMKRQGARTDLTSRPLVGKLESSDIMGQSMGESGRQINAISASPS